MGSASLFQQQNWPILALRITMQGHRVMVWVARDVFWGEQSE